MSKYMEIACFLPQRVREYITNKVFLKMDFTGLEEIRLRACKPLIVVFNNLELVCTDFVVTREEIQRMLELASEYSLYAYKEDIKNGYITVGGGHRVGVMGQVITDNKGIANQKNISFVNIRVAHEVKGCSDKVMDFVCREGGLRSTLIVSPPGCGKTTLLRDIVRRISDGYKGLKATVTVVDERCEIAACFNGVPQNDVGLRTDVVDRVKKSEGIIMAIRAMSPELIAVDELGEIQDFEAIRKALYSGCYCIATVHGFDLCSLMNRSEISDLIGIDKFERIIVLSKKNKVGEIVQMFDVRDVDGGTCVY